MLLSTACCRSFSALACKISYLQIVNKKSARNLCRGCQCINLGLVFVEQGQHNLSMISKIYKEAYFFCNTAIAILQLLMPFHSLLHHLTHLVENHIAAVLLNRRHAPCKEGHLGEKISGSPGHHNVETKLKHSKSRQDNLKGKSDLGQYHC